MSALEDQFLGLWQAKFPSIALEREFSDVEEWERDFQERYSKSKRSKRYRADFAHPESLDASSKFKAALICAAGMSVDPAMSVMRGNSTWP